MRKFILLAALSAVSVAANAAVTAVSSRASLAATEDLDLGQFGASTPNPNEVDLGPSVVGTGSMGTMFSVASNHLVREDQGNGWAGTFSSGDKLLWNDDYRYGNGNDMTITFAKTLSSVGFNVQGDYFGGYTATATAFDGLGTNLGSVSVTGTATPAGDGSAAFLGLASADMNIAKIVISVNSSGRDDFAINHIGINTCEAVPEPASMAALGLGAVGLLRRRKKA